MNKEKLLAIAKLMRETPVDKIDMSVWRCGSTACAIGTAILAGVLPGLELIKAKRYHTARYFSLYPVPKGCDALWVLEQGDDFDFGFGSVAKELGISLWEANRLFSEDEYSEFLVQVAEDGYEYERPINLLVAEKIEAFVERRAHD